MEEAAVLSFRITTGNKKLLRIVVCVLILCFLLGACSNSTDTKEGDETGHDTVTDPTGTTSVIIDKKEQNSTEPTGNTIPEDGSASEGSVPSTEPSERPTDNSGETIPGNGNDGASTTEPSTTPSDNTTTTTPESDGNGMPDYGIELPDDNWD